MKSTVLRVHRRPEQSPCSGVLLTGSIVEYIRSNMDLDEALSLFHVSPDAFTLMFVPMRAETALSHALDVVVGQEVRVRCGLLLPLCESFEPFKHKECTAVDYYHVCEQTTGEAIWLAEALVDLNS